MCWGIKQQCPPVCDLCPLSLFPLGLFMWLILTHVLGRAVTKEARIISSRSSPRVLQKQCSGGKQEGWRHENNTNPKAICVKGWKSSSWLLSKKFLWLSKNKGFQFLCFMYQTVLCDGEHWLGKAQKVIFFSPWVSKLGSWAVIFANFMGNLILLSDFLLLLTTLHRRVTYKCRKLTT